MRDSVPRIFEVLEEGDVPAAFWRYFSVDPARRGSNPQGLLERTVQALLRVETPRGRVLSVGCGYGLHEVLLAALVPEADRIVGVDILDDKKSAEKIRTMQAILRRLRLGRVTAMLADAGRLPFRSGSFDAVVAIDCLSHADYVREHLSLEAGQALLLREMVRVTGPRGLVAVLENNLLSPRNVMSKHGTMCHPVNPFFLRSILKRSGFPRTRVLPFYDLHGRRDLPARAAGAVLRMSRSLGLFVAPWFVLTARRG